MHGPLKLKLWNGMNQSPEDLSLGHQSFDCFWFVNTLKTWFICSRVQEYLPCVCVYAIIQAFILLSMWCKCSKRTQICTKCTDSRKQRPTPCSPFIRSMHVNEPEWIHEKSVFDEAIMLRFTCRSSIMWYYFFCLGKVNTLSLSQSTFQCVRSSCAFCRIMEESPWDYYSSPVTQIEWTT